MLKLRGQAETVCKLPAYLRGLAFFDDCDRRLVQDS